MTAWWVLVIAYALVVAGSLVMFKGGTKRATVGLWLVLGGMVCALMWLVAVIRS